MKVEVICKENDLAERLQIKLIPYKEAVKLAFDKIDQQDVISSWIDAQSSNVLAKGISNLIEVPTFGCFQDKKQSETKKKRLIKFGLLAVKMAGIMEIFCGRCADLWTSFPAESV